MMNRHQSLETVGAFPMKALLSPEKSARSISASLL
jgi:hypothetical protein